MTFANKHNFHVPAIATNLKNGKLKMYLKFALKSLVVYIFHHKSSKFTWKIKIPAVDTLVKGVKYV